MKSRILGFWILVLLYNCNLNAQDSTIDDGILKLDSMRVIYGLTVFKDSIDFQRFVDSLMTSANHATNQRNFDKAIVYLEMGENAAMHYIGENSIAHARILYSFGFSYARNNAFVKAEPYLERALKIYEMHYGAACEKCAKTLNTLGFVYHFQGKYDKVEACLEKSVSIYEKLYGKYQSDYINSFNSLCIFLRESGQYEKALQKFPELLELNEKLYSKQNNNYISALVNFSNLLVELDQFDKAEELRWEAVQISESLNGKQNATYAQALFALATFYKSINQTEKAEKYLVETQRIYENLSLTNLPEYARVLNNLGNLYLSFDKYSIAENYLLNANKILENVLGNRHFEYAQSLESIGVLKLRIGLFNEAEQLISEALKIKLASRGKNEDYTNTLMLLANVYVSTNKVDDAQAILDESLNIRQRLFGNQHKAISESLKALSEVYEIKANYHLADSFRLEYFSVVQAIFKKAMNYMSMNQLKHFSENYLADLDQSIQCYFKRNSDSRDLAAICYNTNLYYKGFILNELVAQKSILRRNPNLNDRYKLLQTYSRQLAAQLSKPVIEQINLAFLEDKIEQLEKEFVKEISMYEQSIHSKYWQDVRKSLKIGEAAIEFIQYRNEKDSNLYAAMILTKQSSSLALIPLFREYQLTEIIESIQNRALHSSNVYNLHEELKPDDLNSLYKLIWKPLLPYLAEINSVYFSPAGLLHRINLAAIKDSFGNCLMDQYMIITVNSSRQVIYNAGNPEKVWNNQAFLMGGIQYELYKEQNVQVSTSSSLVASAKRALSYETRDSSYKVSSWTYLPATFKEVQKLDDLLQAAKFETKLFTSHEATETVCKKLDLSLYSPRILHFATHGFFYPDQNKISGENIKSFPVFQQSKDPMIRSGLILANANFAWKHGYIHESLEDDGILTALEVSQLNLSNTELVVLSACETGLGDIKGNEGVYGLQRAFKIAGAKYLMMSLWQVPDRETKEFMVSFYKNWLTKKKSIPEAFRMTQKEMRERFINPYAWAGFVLVE